jgi:hypothetical protein
MKRFAPTILLALVLALGGFLAVAAAAPEILPGAAGLTPREAIGRTIVRLNLSDAQKREVAKVLASHKEAARTAFERVRAAARPSTRWSLRRGRRGRRAPGLPGPGRGRRGGRGGQGPIMAEVRQKLTPEQLRIFREGRDVVAEKVRERVETARSLCRSGSTPMPRTPVDRGPDHGARRRS